MPSGGGALLQAEGTARGRPRYVMFKMGSSVLAHQVRRGEVGDEAQPSSRPIGGKGVLSGKGLNWSCWRAARILRRSV